MNKYIRKTYFIFFWAYLFFSVSAFSQKTMHITIHFDDYAIKDKFTLRVWDHIFNPPDLAPFREYSSIANKEGDFIFFVPEINQPYVYISLAKDEAVGGGLLFPFIKYYLAKQGDSIFINIGRLVNNSNYFEKDKMTVNTIKSIQFRGRGAGKYECQWILQKRDIAITDSINSFPPPSLLPKTNDSLSHLRYFSNIPRWLDFEILRASMRDSVLIKTLNQVKHKLGRSEYNILRANIVGNIDLSVAYAFRSNYGILESFYKLRKFLTRELKDSLQLILKKEYRDFPRRSVNFFLVNEIVQSFWYTEYLVGDAGAEANFDWDEACELLIAKYKGLLRDKLLASLFSNPDKFKLMKHATANLQKAIKLVANGYCKDQLLLINDRQAVGTLAFNFSLPDRNGQLVKLSDFKGKVVFVDFWFTGCVNCAIYYKSHISKAEEYFKNNPNVVFVSISIDNNKELWIESADKEIYTSSRAINLYTAGKGWEHDVIKAYSVIGAPRPILIGRDGEIVSNNFEELRGYDSYSLIKTISKAVK